MVGRKMRRCCKNRDQRPRCCQFESPIVYTPNGLDSLLDLTEQRPPITEETFDFPIQQLTGVRLDLESNFDSSLGIFGSADSYQATFSLIDTITFNFNGNVGFGISFLSSGSVTSNRLGVFELYLARHRTAISIVGSDPNGNLISGGAEYGGVVGEFEYYNNQRDLRCSPRTYPYGPTLLQVDITASIIFGQVRFDQEVQGDNGDTFCCYEIPYTLELQGTDNDPPSERFDLNQNPSCSPLPPIPQPRIQGGTDSGSVYLKTVPGVTRIPYEHENRNTRAGFVSSLPDRFATQRHTVQYTPGPLSESVQGCGG